MAARGAGSQFNSGRNCDASTFAPEIATRPHLPAEIATRPHLRPPKLRRVHISPKPVCRRPDAGRDRRSVPPRHLPIHASYNFCRRDRSYMMGVHLRESPARTSTPTMPHMPLMTHRVLCSETTSVSYSRPWRSRLDARDQCKDHHRCRGGRDSGRPVGVDRGLVDGGGGGAIAGYLNGGDRPCGVPISLRLTANGIASATGTNGGGYRLCGVPISSTPGEMA